MFLQAARHGSFAEAAASLHVTQAAVSKQVATLEHRLGAALFERGHRSITLTEAGRRYLCVAEGVIALLESGQSEAVQAAAHETLTVEVDYEFLNFFLSPRLPRLRAALPGIGLRFVPEMLAPRRGGAVCDMAIIYGHPGERGAKPERLTGFTVFAVGAPSFLDGASAPLAELPLLHDLDTFWWEAVLKAEGITRSDPPVILGHGALAIHAAVAGKGLAVGDDLLCAEALMAGALVPVGTARFPGRADYWLTSVGKAPERAVEREFRAWLFGEVAQRSTL
ncbi:MAG: LysR family transcriptional regulator [Pseudomonadota bacterium]